MNTPNPTPVTTTAEDAQEVAADIRNSAPAHIWLDLGEGAELPGLTFRDLREVSWSEDNATGIGIKYVRAPVAVATSDAERAAFESTVGKGRVLLRDPHIGDYVSAYVQNDWDVWRVACKEIQRAACNFCLAEAAKARAALPIDFKQAADQGGWQPIATAPTDGTCVLVNDTTGLFADYCMAKWLDGDEWTGWVYDDEATADNNPLGPQPTHFMRIAAPTLLGVADGDAVGGKSGGAE